MILSSGLSPAFSAAQPVTSFPIGTPVPSSSASILNSIPSAPFVFSDRLRAGTLITPVASGSSSTLTAATSVPTATSSGTIDPTGRPFASTFNSARSYASILSTTFAVTIRPFSNSTSSDPLSTSLAFVSAYPSALTIVPSATCSPSRSTRTVDSRAAFVSGRHSASAAVCCLLNRERSRPVRGPPNPPFWARFIKSSSGFAPGAPGAPGVPPPCMRFCSSFIISSSGFPPP